MIRIDIMTPIITRLLKVQHYHSPPVSGLLIGGLTQQLQTDVASQPLLLPVDPQDPVAASCCEAPPSTRIRESVFIVEKSAVNCIRISFNVSIFRIIKLLPTHTAFRHPPLFTSLFWIIYTGYNNLLFQSAVHSEIGYQSH